MSRLQDLINELCPDGVEYKTLGDCVQKTSNIKWKTTEGSYFYIDLTSVDRDTHKITEIQTVNETNAPSRAQQIVLKGDVLFATTRPTLKRFCLINDKYDGQVCSTGFCVLRAKENLVIPQWLFHIVSSSEFYYYVEAKQKGASYPAISDKEVKQFEIPVPPLPVQREIVRILDNFTELTAELTTELTARKKQYEYYRDQLLTFDNTVRFERLGNTCNMKSGKAIASTQINIEETSAYPYQCFGGNGVRGFVANASNHGDFPIIGRQGALCGNINYATGDFYATEHAVVVESKGPYLQRFLYYLLTSMNLNQYKSQGAQPGLAVGNLEELIAPIPPLEEQQRIVSILDRFDILCNDLTSGLPAEIEARQKQYEYYRDKLLTFQPLEKGGA